MRLAPRDPLQKMVGRWHEPHFLSRASSSRPRDSRVSGLVPMLRDANPEFRRSLPPETSHLFPAFQSLHFANRNRPNSMKTSAEKKFNRYTFRVFRGSRHCLRGGETKANRDNPTFKNRCNSLTTNEKPFSNRDKNTTFASPHFRPADHQSPITNHQSRDTGHGTLVESMGTAICARGR
jgi:hypothetical protein